MIHNSTLRIFSGHPVRDRIGAYAERAEKRIGDAKKRLFGRANPAIDRMDSAIWEGILRLVDMEQRAGEMRGRISGRFWERAEPKLENVCEGLLMLGAAERKMGRAAYALKERGLDGFALFLKRALDLEEKAESIISETAKTEMAKARAIGRIFFFWKLTKEAEEFKREPNFLDEDGPPRPPRAKGMVIQDASGWYNECGAPRYPVTTGTAAVHMFDATQVRHPNED